MKKIILFAALLLQTVIMNAQDIKLPSPDLSQPSKTVIEALRTRHSVREFSDKKLSLVQISALCWAACGQTRDDEHITSPTAMNRQEIRLYVFNENGVYEYVGKENLLKNVAFGDHRKLIAGAPERSQNFVLDAPVSLLMVADFDKFGMPMEASLPMVAADAGIVSENINLYCESVGLATVPRATMDKAGLAALLGFTSSQLPLLNNPVGYPAE